MKVFDKFTVSIVVNAWKNEVVKSVTAVLLRFTVFNAVGIVPPAVAEVPPNKYLKSLLAAGNESIFKVSVSRFVVPCKTVVPVVVNESGMTSDVSSVAFKNALLPILTNALGNVIVVIPEFANALIPIVVIPLCNVTVVNLDAPLNVSDGIVVIPVGMTAVFNPLFWNTFVPKVVRPTGRTIFSNNVVPKNALFWILLNLASKLIVSIDPNKWK